MFKQERLIGSVDYQIQKDTGTHNAYEKYCGYLTIEDVFTSDHVAICAGRCASGFMDKADTRQFMKAYEYNSRLLCKKVLSGKYRPKYYKTREIMERGKMRLIRPPVFECKVVQKVICDYVIQPLLTPKMTSTSYASVTGRGTDRMYEDIEKELNHLLRTGKTDKVIIITDYRGYFASIPHDGLEADFDRYIIDVRITALIMLFCENDEGLSLGNEVSQVPASYYPSPVDHWIKDENRIPSYRYMDDVLSVVDEDRKDWYISEFKHRSEEIGLFVKDEKILVFRLGTEFVFCKEHFYIDKRTNLYYRMMNGHRVGTEIRKINAAFNRGVKKENILLQYKSVRGSIANHINTYGYVQKLDKAFLERYGKELAMTVHAVIPNAEIRGCEVKTSKTGTKYLLVRIDVPENTTGETAGIADMDVSREKMYRKGLFGDLHILIRFERYKEVEISGFEPHEQPLLSA